jgi:hypothetical protein
MKEGKSSATGYQRGGAMDQKRQQYLMAFCGSFPKIPNLKKSIFEI